MGLVGYVATTLVIDGVSIFRSSANRSASLFLGMIPTSMTGLTHTSQTISGRHNVARPRIPFYSSTFGKGLQLSAEPAHGMLGRSRFGRLTWIALQHTLTREVPPRPSGRSQ